MVSFKLIMKEGLRFCTDIIHQVPQPLNTLTYIFQAPFKVASRIMEQGNPRAAGTTDQTNDQADSPELFSTAMFEQSLDPDAPEPRSYTIEELFTAVIENDIELPEPTVLTETDVHRPGQPLLDEHGVPQIFPRGMTLESIKAEVDRTKESDLPDKAFAGLRAKPSGDKKPIPARDRVIDHYSSGEEADSGEKVDSGEEADSGDEADSDDQGGASSGPILSNDDAVFDFLKKHHPEHFAALAPQTEAETQFVKERHDALVARIDELNAAGLPTTIAGPRYIDDYGRTLDVDLLTPASPTPSVSSPPPNGPPKGPNDKKQAKTKKKNEKRKEKRDAARKAKALSSATIEVEASTQQEAIKENEEAEMGEVAGPVDGGGVEGGAEWETDSASDYSQEGM